MKEIYERPVCKQDAKEIINSDSILSQLCATDTATQRNIILKHLREIGPATTFDFREIYGICAPAPRVFELRHNGLKIETHFVTARDGAGNAHRNVALYALKSSVNAEVMGD